MVSSLWKACAEGDLDRVSELLNDGQAVDIEVKGMSLFRRFSFPPHHLFPIGFILTRIDFYEDHTGVTPLICAVQTGKVDLVRMLLDKGASLCIFAVSLTLLMLTPPSLRRS